MGRLCSGSWSLRDSPNCRLRATGGQGARLKTRGTVDQNQIAIIGWDIFTPEREGAGGLLSMLLSTTWTSPMEPWPGSDEWYISTYAMPMSDGGSWWLYYRDLGAGRFELGAPPFLDPATVPQYEVTDNRQRTWTFSQPFLVIPEPSMVGLVVGLLGGVGVYGALSRSRVAQVLEPERLKDARGW